MKCKNCGNEIMDGAKFCPNGDNQEKIVLNDISDIYSLATQLKTRLNELH